MAKIVYNACFGGFGLSAEAVEMGKAISGDPDWGSYDCMDKTERHDAVLVSVVEAIGKKASGFYADLRVMDVLDGTRYRIDEYDGRETVVTSYDDWSIAR